MATKGKHRSQPGDRKRRPRRVLRRLIFFLLLLAIAVAVAPTIVAKTSLRNLLLTKAMSAAGWRIESQQATLAWTGEQTLSGVTLVDSAGKLLLSAETISVERSLLSLAANPSDLGKLKIVRPVVNVVTRPEGSNVEDFLAAMGASSSVEEDESSLLADGSLSGSVEIAIEIIEGTVRGLDEASGQQWLLDQANFVVELGSATPGGFALNGSLSLRSGQNGLPGRIQVRLQQIAEHQSQLDLLAENLPLVPLEPWLSRIVPGSRLMGTASSTAQVRWTQDPQRGLLVQTSGRLEASQLDLTADVLAGDRLRCQKLSVPWELSFDGDMMTVGQLTLDTGWAHLQVNGSATLEELASLSMTSFPKREASVVGSVQLDQLAAMLPHTLQLREGVQIDSGDLKFQAAGKQGAEGFAWSAAATVQNVVGSDGPRAIRWEQPIEAKVELADTAQGPQVKQLSLRAPFVEADFQTSAEDITGSFQLDLGLLSQEIGQLVDLDAWQFRGKGEGTLSLARKSDYPFDASAKIHLTDLHIARAGTMAIDEPRVQFSGDCRWDPAGNSLHSRELQLVSSSLAFRSRNISIELGEDSGPTAAGDVAFRADLERLASAFGLVGQSESTWPRGAMTGNLQLSSNAQRLEANFSATTEQLQVVRTAPTSGAAFGPPEIVWSEPQLAATGKAIYTITEDRLTLQDISLTGQTVRLNGSATLDKPSAEGLLQAAGTLEYNEAALDQLLVSYLGPEVRLRGDRQIRFEVSGRLADVDSAHWSRRWNVSTDAGWTAAAVYGLPLSPGRIQATLRDGQLQFTPLDIGVEQGRLTASPRVIFDPGPQQLILSQGPLITNVRISPQVSETMLKYVAPIVAGATRTEGEFSVELEDTQVPFANPKRARVAGRLTVHRMKVAPGPMVVELVALIDQIDALTKGKQLFQAASSSGGDKALTIDNRQIDFQIVEGRVYHRNLEFVVDGVPIRSHGSVGFDQTLALVIEIPIQDKWIDRQRALKSLAGQSLQIPIQGTFQKPRIDQRAVADLSRQLLQGVATEAIGGEINRALDKLFK